MHTREGTPDLIDGILVKSKYTLCIGTLDIKKGKESKTRESVVHSKMWYQKKAFSVVEWFCALWMGSSLFDRFKWFVWA